MDSDVGRELIKKTTTQLGAIGFDDLRKKMRIISLTISGQTIVAVDWLYRMLTLSECGRLYWKILFNPSAGFRKSLGLDAGKQTLRTSIKNRLHIKNRKAARQAIISNRDMSTRLAYANQHRLRTEAEWRRTVAIDEKVFFTVKDGKQLF
ncbi:hypothetical protein TSAR_013721 [Trichomalopsis sarcophagae]|uniref:Transposase Tc1-like domain-containing protein n=1 Tax=Trichomalopsis sarcophagae TaxID=543379 RepID=A0A232FAL1_9HYME|nr:hypothetical protein TSAR_013721 [Trichomalopsis sarcophagae]